jgi:methionine sulfoxide reductase heme-binding subunit
MRGSDRGMSVTWYAVRASGMVAFVLLTTAIALGLVMSGRARLRRWPRFALEDVHRFASLLTWSFIGVHALALLADSYLPISFRDLVIPGSSPYRPLPTALGVVAAELLAALAVANLLRGRIGYKAWRQAHYLNFGVWILALGHGVASGADSDTAWGLATYVFSASLVAGLTAWRVLSMRSAGAWAVRVGAPLAALVAADLAIFLDLGVVR